MGKFDRGWANFHFKMANLGLRREEGWKVLGAVMTGFEYIELEGAILQQYAEVLLSGSARRLLWGVESKMAEVGKLAEERRKSQ